MPTNTHPIQHWGSLPETHDEGFWIFVKPHRFLSSSPIQQRWQFAIDAIADAQQFIEGGHRNG